MVLPPLAQNFEPGDLVEDLNDDTKKGVVVQVEGPLVQVHFGVQILWRRPSDLKLSICPNCGGNHWSS